MRVFGRKIRVRDAVRVLLDMPGDIHYDRFVAVTHAVRSPLCVCGERKWSGFALCQTCFKLLPKPLKSRVHFMIKRRFVRGYEDAIAYLLRIRGSHIEKAA